jgi:hypothetical protein
MPLGALVGLAAFVLFSVVLGARLFRIARRGGGPPVYALAIAFTMSGGLGAALQAVRPLDLGSDAFQAAAWVAVRLSMDLGIACQVFFTARVFHPRSRGATLGIAAFVGALILVLACYAAVGAIGTPLYRGLWFWIEAALHTLGLGFGALESLRYYVRTRKRVRLGLADPVVTNRFLLWGVAVLGAMGAVAVPVGFEALGLENQPGLIAGVSAAFALVSTVAYGLTFFPPSAYRRLLERRAARA